MWSCELMSAGETTPSGQVIVVAPCTCASHEQPTQVMAPVASTRTPPPRKICPAVRTVPRMSLAALPGVTEQVPAATGASTPQVTSVPGRLQVASQPSPLVVLPSSQSSPGSSFPLPQSPSFVHVAEQPSPALVFPSSHCSPGSTLPLPHAPGSLAHADEQPSPLTELP